METIAEAKAAFGEGTTICDVKPGEKSIPVRQKTQNNTILSGNGDCPQRAKSLFFIHKIQPEKGSVQAYERILEITIQLIFTAIGDGSATSSRL